MTQNGINLMRRLSSPMRHAGVRITESAPPVWLAG